MARILTGFDCALLSMQTSDFEQLCPCECEGRCECPFTNQEEEQDEG